MGEEWIYVKSGDCVIRFRVRPVYMFLCSCAFRPFGVIEYIATAMQPNYGFWDACVCESCWHKLVGHDVVFLTPEEGRPYFEVLPV